MYPVALGLLLVGAEAFRGLEVTRPVVLGVLAVVAFALPGNLLQLRESGAALPSTSELVRARLAMVELESDRIDPGFGDPLDLPMRSGDYLRAVDRYGSFAFSLGELPRQSPAARAEADKTLARILSPTIIPARASSQPRCRTVPGGPALTRTLLPRGGTVLISESASTVRLGRFGPGFAIDVPGLVRGRRGALWIPADRARRPWRASLAPSGAVSVCPLTAEDALAGAREAQRRRLGAARRRERSSAAGRTGSPSSGAAGGAVRESRP